MGWWWWNRARPWRSQHSPYGLGGVSTRFVGLAVTSVRRDLRRCAQEASDVLPMPTVGKQLPDGGILVVEGLEKFRGP